MQHLSRIDDPLGLGALVDIESRRREGLTRRSRLATCTTTSSRWCPAPTTSLHVVEQYLVARDMCAQRFGVMIDHRVEYEVVPIVQAVCGRSPDITPT
jgi:hypothetical protein